MSADENTYDRSFYSSEPKDNSDRPIGVPDWGQREENEDIYGQSREAPAPEEPVATETRSHYENEEPAARAETPSNFWDVPAQTYVHDDDDGDDDGDADADADAIASRDLPSVEEPRYEEPVQRSIQCDDDKVFEIELRTPPAADEAVASDVVEEFEADAAEDVASDMVEDVASTTVWENDDTRSEQKVRNDISEAILEFADCYADCASSINSASTASLAFGLPFLMALGYDTANPRDVTGEELLEQSTIRYDVREEEAFRFSLFVSSPQGKAASESLLRTCPGTIAVLLKGEHFHFMGQTDSGSWETAFELSLSKPGSLQGIEFLAWETFDADAFKALILDGNAIADVRTAIVDEMIKSPATFLDAVQELVKARGMAVPAMLERQISLVGASILDALANPSRQPPVPSESDANSSDDRVMTGDETLAFEAIRNLVKQQGRVDVSRIVPRPGKVYCAILLDDNNRKSIARLHFSGASVKYIGTFVGKEETRHKIDTAESVADYADAILARLKELDPGAWVNPEEVQI